MGIKAVSVGTSATKILSANTQRQSFIITNNEDDETVYLGPDNTVTTIDGIPIFAKGFMASDKGFNLYRADIFGIVASGTADVRVWDRTEQQI